MCVRCKGENAERIMFFHNFLNCPKDFLASTIVSFNTMSEIVSCKYKYKKIVVAWY